MPVTRCCGIPFRMLLWIHDRYLRSRRTGTFVRTGEQTCKDVRPAGYTGRWVTIRRWQNMLQQLLLFTGKANGIDEADGEAEEANRNGEAADPGNQAPVM